MALDRQDLTERSARPRRWYVPSPSGLDRLAASIDRLRLAAGASLEREAERGRIALWVPVLLGVGILAYFALPREPSLVALVAVALGAAAIAYRSRARIGAFRLWSAVALVLAGAALMTARTAMVATPVLAEAETGDLVGVVESIEVQGPNQHRLVVAVETFEGVALAETPRKARITVRGDLAEIAIGSRIEGLVALFPPPGPVMPGAYDFGRELFFRGIGASGFSYGPPDVVGGEQRSLGDRFAAVIADIRSGVGERIEAAIPGEAGAIARALVTGDRSGISDETAEALRRSGLGHILAISGLHMALVVGAVFGGLRALLALSPTLALHRPIKKWAALGALAAAAFYLVLSGASVATQRSFIMLAVMLLAVLLDRRAFSVRNVAVAATIVLLLTPEALLTASFQMSFAATLALIAGFEVVAERRRRQLAIGPPPDRTIIRRALYWAAGLALTSILAGLATAPFAAFHFHRTAPLSLVANLAAMPLFSLLVMPMALLGVLLMPFGLEVFPLSAMEWGLDRVVAVAEAVDGWTGSSGLVAAMPSWSLLAIAFGLVWLCVWRQRWRLLGVPVTDAGIAIAAFAERPTVLVDETGEVVAVRGPEGRYAILGANADFEIDAWLRADADPRATNDPSLPDGVLCDALGCTAPFGDTAWRVAMPTSPQALAEDCRLAALVVTTLPAPADCVAPAIDGAALAAGGAHALYLDGEVENGRPAFRIVTARPELRRPWMPPLSDQ